MNNESERIEDTSAEDWKPKSEVGMEEDGKRHEFLRGKSESL